jgi:hypothetical protein
MNMGETVTGDPAPEQLLRRTRELRLGLLRLHKTLLDGERTTYEPDAREGDVALIRRHIETVP